MTRLADLLRGAADRAPVEAASVSTSRAARSVRVRRGVRGVGNGVAGLGAVAVIAFGVVQPGSAMDKTAANAMADSAPAPEAAPQLGAGAASDALARLDGRSMSWGDCGSFPLQDYGTGGTDALSISVGVDGGMTPEGGSTLDVPVTVTANTDLNVSTSRPDVVVLWDGMVVASLTGAEAEQTYVLAAGDRVESAISLGLVDCFQGNPLPASKYELVASQAFLDAVAPEPATPAEPAPSATAEPTTEPAPAPTPTTAPTPQTTFPLNPDAGGGTASSSEASSSEASSESADPGSADTMIMPVEPPSWDYRITSEPIGFAIAGDPVDNPFADYFPQPWSPPAQPDDILTPATARAAFDAKATSTPWDMAKGSSRWTLPGGYGGTETFAPVPAKDEGYFGCSWDGTAAPTFPSRSADLGWLTLSAKAPARASISYGWVVDDNPTVSLAMTNTSPYSIPGFYGEPNHSLYLVKNGRVVAQAYPVNIDPTGGVLRSVGGIATDDVATGPVAPLPEEDPASYWGTLAPGETLSGTYLWRDANGCVGRDGAPAAIGPGTYTLLTMQSVSLQDYWSGTGGGIMVPEPQTFTSKGGGDSDGAPTATDISVDPVPPLTGPDQVDWLEFQVWFSLGDVTITTR